MSGDGTPNDWQELEALIDQVLDSPPERRAALIAELSRGDEARRAELERLVLECEQAYPLLDRPVAERFATLLEDHVTRIPDVLADRYRVVRELGRGGMAVVYLARDMKHERDVAVKVVRPEVAASLGRERFLREIAIAAKLKHPHIVHLFDSGEVENLLYYVMPYEEGDSLRARLTRDGRLPIADTVSILRDVCDALAYAHQQGIVHRDIKPENVLLSGRHAMVTDFGIARAYTAASEPTTLITGATVLGTPAYMAPEQASASLAIDHRVDLYAVGVMAFEMLAGERPFSGDTPPSQQTAHSEKAFEHLTRLRSDVPAALAAVVDKCLVAQPEGRHQRAEDVLAALEGFVTTSGRRTIRRPSWISKAAILAGAAAVVVVIWSLWPTDRAAMARPAPRIAVLVLQHDGSDALEPLAMGLTENLIAVLSDAGLHVRSLSAVLPYRGGLTPIDTVARRLDVNWLVTGRVYARTDSTVAAVALIDAVGNQLARAGATAPFGDDVRLIEALVPQVAALLRERVGAVVRIEGWRAGTRSDEAFAAVNRADREVRDARFLLTAGDIKGALIRLSSADSALERSMRADQRWVEPRIQRAWVARHRAGVLAAIAPDSVPTAILRGVAHAEAALQLRPDAPRALEVLGVLLHTWSLLAAPNDSAAALQDSAEKLLKKATDADTTLVRALNTLSLIHFQRSHYEEASLFAARAYAADAYSEDALQLLARLFTVNFEDNEDLEARRWCTEFRRVFPRDWFGGYCQLLLMIWDPTEVPNAESARKIMRNATAMAPEVIRPAVGAQLEVLLAGVLARTGPASAADRVLADVRTRAATDTNITSGPHGAELLLLEASVRTRLGQHDVVVSLLQEYVRRRPKESRAFERSRRFKDLPTELLRDAIGLSRE